ncbi:putative ATPase [Archaeoglobus fulgidus DSM 8774]|uniref:Putative ATPase n=1 Tax=Archaeoglobus fulgidus DSM 8774 TaxID=1344584 RepID=A0A075WDF1_ARCFL|nr:ATP-binding protein [Archaeoglobus fulgidus]AIG98450.1 putative ATPase [Archaeoglobus fulgidus DSM 8774]
MSGSLEKLGVVFGDASPTEFYFVTDENKHPPRWEYVLVKSKENIDGEEVKVDVIAQIDAIYSSSMALSGKPSLDVVEKIRDAGLVDKRLFAKARVLGFLYEGNVLQPRRAIYPGNDVFRAPENILKDFYSYPEEEGLFIGHLITRQDVPVSISVRGFRRHLAILAQTGAGKSYAAGVLLEELLKKGATVVVLDPHADYVFLSRKKDGSKFSDRVSVFRTPESTGRYDESQIGKVNSYEVKFSDLSIDEIVTVCGISERWTKIIGAIREAIEELGKSCSLNDLIKKLEERGDPDSLRALNYVRRLSKIRVFGSATTDIEKLLKPKHISVVDLSGLDDRVSDYIAFRILSGIYEKAETQQYRYPVFVFVEEAHRFIPNRENTLSKGIIKRIAAEGRKFGVFLVLITQRPYKIDPDALSQCNSQIIMRMTNPEDQRAVKNSSERMSESLLNDLPGLNVGEAVIVGEVTRAPVMVKIRQRETEEGGADIDVVEKLREAVKEAEEEEEGREERLREELDMYKGIVEG